MVFSLLYALRALRAYCGSHMRLKKSANVLVVTLAG
jgi:hypothetical protein